MGGFHIALNFLGVIGHLFEGSGLEDIFIEAGLYGSSTVSRFLKGKCITGESGLISCYWKL